MHRRPCVTWCLAALLVTILASAGSGIGGCAATRPAIVEEAMDTKPLPVPAEDPITHLWGFQGPDGAWELPPTFALVLEFTPGGIAAVADREGWRFVDRRALTVVARPWVVDNTPDPFQEGLARAVEEGVFVFFDERGRTTLRTAYAYAEPFAGGLALVCANCRPERIGEHVRWTGGKWGFIDKAGREVIPCRYDDAGSFDEGVARVKLNGEWLSIDPSGRTVVE